MMTVIGRWPFEIEEVDEMMSQQIYPGRSLSFSVDLFDYVPIDHIRS
jgi:hypothetical protein